MATPRSPLLSLGARGTIADALTYQKRGTGHIVRQKPIPRDPYSLNQAYQRWDYQDYAYLWTLLSNSEKQVYRTKASRYHITGFSQWMREQLKTLPNLAVRWHLDERGGALVYDTSKNTNHGTIFGASPTTGLIAGGYYFDGINDRIRALDHPSLQLPDTFSFEIRIRCSPPAGTAAITQKGAIAGAPFNFVLLLLVTGEALFYVRNAANTATWSKSFGNIADDKWHTLAGNFNTTQLEAFTDGVSQGTTLTGQQAHAAPGQHLYIGMLWTNYYPGRADEFALYNEEQPLTLIQRHAERRYTL